MDLNALIPVIDTLAALAEKFPLPHVAVIGAILAGLAVILKKLQNSKNGAPEVTQRPVESVSDAKIDDSVAKKIAQDALKK